jgi:uncharacterized membrane protein
MHFWQRHTLLSYQGNNMILTLLKKHTKRILILSLLGNLFALGYIVGSHYVFGKILYDEPTMRIALLQAVSKTSQEGQEQFKTLFHENADLLKKTRQTLSQQHFNILEHIARDEPDYQMIAQQLGEIEALTYDAHKGINGLLLDYVSKLSASDRKVLADALLDTAKARHEKTPYIQQQ